MGKNLFIILFLIIYANFAWTQGCSNIFSEITANCIKSKIDKVASLEAKLEEANGFIYFYKDTRNNFGKIHIASVIDNTPLKLKNAKFKKDLECIVYFYSNNLSGRKGSATEGNLVIKFDHGDWGSQGVDLSGDGADDLILKNKNGVCYLESANGMLYTPYKKIKSTFKGKGSDTLYYSAFFLIGLAVFLVSLQVFQDNSRYQASETLDEGEAEKPKNHGLILKYSRPFFKRYFSPIVAGMKSRRQIRDKYRQKMATAGLTRDLPPEDFYAWKLFLIIGFPILFLLVRTFIEADWPLYYAFIVGILGYFYPDIWLGGMIQKRQEEIVMNMPFVVDMLALSIESGLDFIAAIAKVIEKAPPSALVEEFDTVLKEIRLGSSRAEALRQFSWRNNSISVSSFTATLVSADSVGASIGPILKVLGREMRQKRSAEVEKKAAAAATKMLLPMMAFILPAIIIIIMAPMILQLFE